MKRKYILYVVTFCLLSMVTIISCSKSGSGSSPVISGSSAVSITSGNLFSPLSITVKVGTAVTWTNSDPTSVHTVTSDNGTSFNSGNIAIGSTYTFTTTVTGTFPYHCTLHPSMTGTLIVTP